MTDVYSCKTYQILQDAPSFFSSSSFSSLSRPCPLSVLPQSPDFVKPSSLISPAGGGRGSPAILRPFPFKLPFFSFLLTAMPSGLQIGPPPASIFQPIVVFFLLQVWARNIFSQQNQICTCVSHGAGLWSPRWKLCSHLDMRVES